MFWAKILIAGVISAYFLRHFISGYSLNVSDPIEGQPVQLSDYPFVDIRKVAKLAKLITPITTLNLCGGLLAPFMKLPLLVRFLLLFQVSSNLALLLIWAFLSLKECMILLDAHTQQQQKSSPEPQAVHSRPGRPQKLGGNRGCLPSIRQIKEKFITFLESRRVAASEGEKLCILTSSQCITIQLAVCNDDLVGGEVDKAGGSGSGYGWGAYGREANRKPYSSYSCAPRISGSNISQDSAIQSASKYEGMPVAVHNVDLVGGKVDEAGGSGSGHGSGASGREENRGRYGGNDGGGGADGGGDRGESGGGHGSGASGSGENSGGYGGHGRDEGGTGSGHGSGASGSGGDSESGGRETNTEQAFKSSKITEMSLMLTAQTTATLIGYHLIPTPSSSSKALLVVALMVQLVGYLCGVTSILLSSNKPEDSKAAKIFADIGFGCSTLGFILMIAMYVAWYLVLIVVLLFGVVWVIFFRNGLKTRVTEVLNYLKNARNL